MLELEIFKIHVVDFSTDFFVVSIVISLNEIFIENEILFHRFEFDAFIDVCKTLLSSSSTFNDTSV